MKNEADIKKVVKTVLLNTAHCWWFMPPANGFGRAGIPDFVGHVNGKFFAVETKFGSGTTTANQKREITNIGEANGKVWVVNEKNLADWELEFHAWVATC